MAAFSFFAGEDYEIGGGSGLGFYGAAGFANSVNVGEYQGLTFITNSAGTQQLQQVDNIKFINAGSGAINGATSGISLTAIPNDKATLNIRFTHSSAVYVQNGKLRIYDRSSINNAASGVTCKVAELIHTNTVNVNDGSGDQTWHTPAGSAVIVDMAKSPGISGLYAGNGSNGNAQSARHDWFFAISASPDSVGSKTLFGLYAETEYL